MRASTNYLLEDQSVLQFRHIGLSSLSSKLSRTGSTSAFGYLTFNHHSESLLTPTGGEGRCQATRACLRSLVAFPKRYGVAVPDVRSRTVVGGPADDHCYSGCPMGVGAFSASFPVSHCLTMQPWTFGGNYQNTGGFFRQDMAALPSTERACAQKRCLNRRRSHRKHLT
jgi:hypothetical protein